MTQEAIGKLVIDATISHHLERQELNLHQLWRTLDLVREGLNLGLARSEVAETRVVEVKL